MSEETKEVEKTAPQGPKKFKKKRNTIPIMIEDENGVERPYTLVELMGSAREDFIDSSAKGVKFDAKGNSLGGGSVRGLHARLIAMSCVDDETGKHVTEKDVNAWPATMQSEIFQMCTKLSALHREAEDDAKKP